MDQGSKAFPLRKNMGATTGSSQKKHEHVLFGGRNGFSKNSFKVVIQRDSQRWVKPQESYVIPLTFWAMEI